MHIKIPTHPIASHIISSILNVLFMIFINKECRLKLLVLNSFCIIAKLLLFIRIEKK